MLRHLSGLTCLLFLGYASVACADSAATSPQDQVLFEKGVRPILKSACFHCHGESGKKEGELDLRLARLMVQGGDSGPSIVPGNRNDSLLYQRVRDGEMPPDKAHRLTPQQVETIGKWIDSGAKTARAEPQDIKGMLITDEERSHWSYQPITRPAIPAVKHPELVRTPIDAFLLAKLEEKGFVFSPPASPTVFARRIRLNMLGLPPTPEQIQEFAQDQRPDASEHLVEELLASPHYGERWGRHWLDVAGYADSDGYSIQDSERKNAWRYRDYVVQAFNDDMPFDRFILEQLAGDELIKSPMNNLTPEDARLLCATGFLRMAPDGTSGAIDDANIARNDAIAATMKIVSSSLLGLTVACAQCHDHRYDPIPTADYYRMRAVFDPALDWKKWRNPQQRQYSLYTDADRKIAGEIETKAKAVEAERLKKQTEFISVTYDKQVEKLPEEMRPAAVAMKDVAAKDRTPEQKELVKKFPNLNISPGSLYLYDAKAAAELKKMADEAKEIRDTKPEEQFVSALTEIPGQSPQSFVFYRGDFEQPKEEVQPGGLAILSMNSPLPEIPVDDPHLPTTGRRIAFAKQLTDPNHPLTARVLVNRIWMHHFGRGLVTTPADFGALGAPPTHPELLDWLAREFIDSGWSVKHIHRLILNSTAYGQALRSSAEQDQVDPQNQLYGGAILQRLDAEAIRDSVLTVSGAINEEMNGAPIPIMADTSGRWVLGIENLLAGRPGPVIPLKAREHLRSLYVQVRRSRPLAILDTFDWPIMSPNCDIRHSSTGTPQSLMLMNSDFVFEYAAMFARRLESAAGDDAKAQIELAWNLTYGRKPNSEELASATRFLEEQTALLAERVKTVPATATAPPVRGAKPAKDAEKPPVLTPRQLGLNSLCQVLLSSNEFLYVE